MKKTKLVLLSFIVVLFSYALANAGSSCWCQITIISKPGSGLPPRSEIVPAPTNDVCASLAWGGVEQNDDGSTTYITACWLITIPPSDPTTPSSDPDPTPTPTPTPGSTPRPGGYHEGDTSPT